MTPRNASDGQPSFAGRLAAFFIDSKLTPLGIILSLLLGCLAIIMLPREEEPQIKVPMIDVMVSMPGATPKEVEERVSIPMEKLIYELPGIEYIYSTSMPGQCLLVARFYVGEKLEDAIVTLNQKLATNFDRIPQGVSAPLIKPHTIDDVPILAITFHSSQYDHYTLRRLAAQVDDAIKNIHEVAETKLIGGTRRQVRILFDPVLLAARNLTAADIIPKLKQANRQTYSGRMQSMNEEVLLQTGRFLASAAEIGRVVVGVHKNNPVYLDEIATVVDGPEEPDNYVLFGSGKGADEEPAVTLSVGKRPGANAVQVVDSVLEKIATLQGTLIPADIEMTVTRNYGETASEKSNELLLHMGIAVFGVALLILFFLGWRESIIVMLAIPSTLSLTLLLFYLYGYTLNRITLFALIFSIGILVDDAIVVVENITRHLRLPSNRKRSLTAIAVEAVEEVGNPTVLATWAVIAAILPMAFVGGLMGPYMRPIPIGSSAAMIFSLLIAFTVTPWAAIRILKKNSAVQLLDDTGNANNHDQAPDDVFTRMYHRIMDPLLAHTSWRFAFFLSIGVLLAASCSLFYFGMVQVKMLPFDNKSEFQIILDMPENAPLEQTTRVAREMAEVVGREAEVTNYQIYAGTSSPFNFNGLVRHYFLRRGPHLADIQVNLLPKTERSTQSHDVAKRVRPKVAAIAKKYGAAVAVTEVPPGPPVLQTLVAEIYGQTDAQRVKLAARVKELFESTAGVVDVDWYREEERRKMVITIDKEKAALSNISDEEVSRAVDMGITGLQVDLFHQPREKEDVNIILELPKAKRTRVEDLLNIQLCRGLSSRALPLIPLRELVQVNEEPVAQPIYRKNLKPVIYVTADVAGAAESPVYAIQELNRKIAALPGQEFGAAGGTIQVYNLTQPFAETAPAIKWDGEWHITLEVFRDLGLAFCAVMILIYMLMVGWFKDYTVPLVVMAAIPFSLIGILPAHWGMGAFFTATSMIGFMAGAGIVVRNSIILVDFIELRLSHGLPLEKAVVEAGAIRFRPMLLTALAVVVGASVILADPIFQGLAISLMFGEIASLLISRMAVPVLYFMLSKHRRTSTLQEIPVFKRPAN